MKRINNILDWYTKTPFLLKWLITIPVVTLSTALFINIMGIPILGKSLEAHVFLNMSIGMGLVMGLFIAVLYTGVKQSDVYWNMAENVETLIKNADTKNKLLSIYDNDFQVLRKKAQGTAHYYENRRLLTIIDTKREFVK